MDTKFSFDEFDPYCRWQRQNHQDVIEVYLKDFKTDQLKVQRKGHGELIIRGERTIDCKKGDRFCKEIKLPKDCQRDGIEAKFSRGILSVTMPKKDEKSKTAAKKEEKSKTAATALELALAAVVLMVTAFQVCVALKYRRCFCHFED